jgi:CRP-like cAMP-binding protein
LLIKREEVLGSIHKHSDLHRVRDNFEFFKDKGAVFDSSNKELFILYEQHSKKIQDKEKTVSYNSVAELIASREETLSQYTDEPVIYQDEKYSLLFFISKIDMGIYAVTSFIGFDVAQKRLSKLSEISVGVFTTLRMANVYSCMPLMMSVTSCF